MDFFKCLVLLLLLLKTDFSSGQYYRCELDATFHIDEESGSRRYYNNMSFTTADGTGTAVPEFELYRQRDDVHLTAVIDIPASRGPIVNLQTATSRQVGSVCLWGGCATWNDDCSGTRTIVIYSGPSTTHCFNKDGWGNWGCLNSLGADWSDAPKIRCYPVYSLYQSDISGILPVEDSIVVSATDGFPASFYKWQYAADLDSIIWHNPFTGSWDTIIRAVTWVDFPPGLTGSNLKISAKALFGSSVQDFINKPVLIRIRKDCDESMDNTAPLIFSVRQDAPHIISATGKAASCFDIKDGQISVRFDRQLKSGEKLNIIFNREDGSGGFATEYTASDLVSLPIGYAYRSPLVLPPGTYIVDLLGTYNINGQNAPTYTGNLHRHSAGAQIDRPSAVAFTKSSVNVWCHGGDDGEIHLRASGGVGNYRYRLFTAADADTNWHSFSTALNADILHLLPKTYYFQVCDANKCMAKNSGGMGSIITEMAVISQPADSIRVDLVAAVDPIAYGFTNGSIQVAVYGGTPPYAYSWTNSSGAVMSTDSAAFVGGVYYAWLNRAGADTFTLLVKDHQYANATNNAGCTHTGSYIIRQPDPLKMQMTIDRQPSCNKYNTEEDPYKDGVLSAYAGGGTPFAPPLLPYRYTWRKKDATGGWNIMSGYTDSIATDLEAGWYAVNIEDAMGIQLAVYSSNVLVQLTDSTIYLPDHALLRVNETINPLSCHDDGSGAIVSNVSGGVAPYQYYWNTGEHKPDLSGIAAGGYFLYVTDTLGCRITKAIRVPEPEGYMLLADTVLPACSGWCDGAISLAMTGGTLPYTYAWQHTALNTHAINGLCAGIYTVTISDANGCRFARIVSLPDPPLLHVNIPRDTTLCNGQMAHFDISITDSLASYSWWSANGFNSEKPGVELVQAGDYIAKIVDHKGCVAQDTFRMQRLQLDIDASILLPSHALVGEEIVLVNTSSPRAEIVEWYAPVQAAIIEAHDDFMRFKVNDTGVYAITLRTGVNTCQEQITRDVVVTRAVNVPGTKLVVPPFIEDLKLVPNPNDGNFTVMLQLREQAGAQVRVIDMMSSKVLAERALNGRKAYVETFRLELAAAGTYLLSVETGTERRTLKLIVN